MYRGGGHLALPISGKDVVGLRCIRVGMQIKYDSTGKKKGQGHVNAPGPRIMRHPLFYL
jgi:hypothetical protein